MNWSEALKATCSFENNTVHNNVPSYIQWALTCRNQSCRCEKDRRQFTLKWKYGLQEERLRRKSQSEALKKVHEMRRKTLLSSHPYFSENMIMKKGSASALISGSTCSKARKSIRFHFIKAKTAEAYEKTNCTQEISGPLEYQITTSPLLYYDFISS